MTAYNFQKQFVPLIEDRTKNQTIRAHRKDNRRPMTGDKLQLYTGMRTKQCRKVSDAICSNVHEIKITSKNITYLTGSWETRILEKGSFARRDGFDTWKEMRDWFNKTHGLPFEGVLIRWYFP